MRTQSPPWQRPLRRYLLSRSPHFQFIHTIRMLPYAPIQENQPGLQSRTLLRWLTRPVFMLTLLLVPLLGVITSGTIYAATSYTIGSAAECTAFLSAIGAPGSANVQCYVYRGTLPAGDTLTLTNNWMLRPQSIGGYTDPPHFVNYGTITGGLYNAGTFENRGVYTVRSGYLGVVIENYGTLVIDGPITHNGTINNYGTIVLTCNGHISGASVITGNAIQEQTNCNYTIGSAAECTAFLSAIGAPGSANVQCYVYRGTLPAGDTLTLTNNWMLRPQSIGGYTDPPHFVNYGTITGGLYNAGTFENRGVYTIRSGYLGVVIENYGTLVIDGPITHNGTINNYGTIRLTCNSAITGASVITGNAPINLCDSIAPTANPTQSPPPAPSGWNNTNVTVNWNWSDNAGGSGIDTANCTTSSVSNGSATITLTATCQDLAGNTGTATYQVRVDPTAPTANPSQSPAANGAGWNNSDVTVNWNWTFTGAIIDTANCTTTSTSSGEGTLTLSATCKDVALNQRTATYQVKVDKTAPVVTVTGVSNSATYTLGSVPTVACSTTDATSGVATQATVSITGGNGDGTGSFTATCSGATDNAGNGASAVSVGYIVVAVATSTPTETATETSQPTATPTATATPSPTSTAIATSTPTPGATNTPLPTPITTPGLASITIALDVRPDAVTNYSFSGSFGAFRLDDAGADDGDNFSNSRTFLVTAGSYSVSRTPTNNRVTSAIDCTLANRAVVNLDADLVTLTVAGGDNLTCTFVVERSSSIAVRVFADLVRNKANLGKRNAGDPWLQGWSVSLFRSPTALIATQVTTPTATADLYEASFADLRPGTYVVCSALPTGAWIFTTPTAVDPLYGLPCKSITLEAAQKGLLLFGVYQATAPATVVAADSAEAVITDEDQIFDLPYDPAEEEGVSEETSAEPANRLFLPLVNR